MKKKRGVLALVDRFSSNGASFQPCSSVTYDGEREVKRVHPFPAVHSAHTAIRVL